jgi:hypothetical protein
MHHMRLIEIRFRHTSDGDWLATAIVEVDGERRTVELGSHEPESIRALAPLLRILAAKV